MRGEISVGWDSGLDAPTVAESVSPTLVEYIGELFGVFHAGHILARQVGERG